MSATFDRSDERVVTEGPEGEREPLQIIIGQRLRRECEHMVLEPRRPDLGDQLVVKCFTQVDSGHCRTACLTRRPYVDPHGRDTRTRTAVTVNRATQPGHRGRPG